MYDGDEGWEGEEDLEKWAETRSWRSPWTMLRHLLFILKAVGWTQKGFMQAQDKRIQCIYWNVHIGKIKKYVIMCSVYTIKDGKSIQ